VALSSPKSRKFLIFWKYVHLKDESVERFFYKIKRRGGSPTSAPRVKFYHRGFRKVVLGPPKSSKYRLFGINLPLRVFYKVWHGVGVPSSHHHAIFSFVAL